MLCGLNLENIEHLFVNCPQIKYVWSHLSNVLSHNIEFNEGIMSSHWLNNSRNCDIVCVSSTIAVVNCMVWKVRCNTIFIGTPSSLDGIVLRAIEHVIEYVVYI